MVPSWESSVSPSMNSWMSLQYVLIRILERGGHRWRMFRRAVSLFRALKAFVASIKITASVSLES